MPPPRLRVLVHEAPLLVGLATAWSLLWLRGYAFVLDGRARGYDWFDYLNHGWMVVHHQDVGYDYFRSPLHAALVGGLGEALGSYIDAGVIVSSLAMVGVVLAAGLLARALAGPWAGGAAALAVTMLRLSLMGTHHANAYPLLGATVGLALAMGAATTRWPRWSWATSAGVASGLAAATDGRGAFSLFGVAAFVLLGALRARRWGLVLAFALPALLVAQVNRPLWPRPDRPFTWEHKLQVQRQVVTRWIDISRDPVLQHQCASFTEADALRADSLQTPCARAMAAHSWRDSFPSHLPFGPLATLLALPLTLLPGRGAGKRWRVASGAVLVVGGLGPLALLSGLTLLPDRYFFQDTVALCVLVPVALSRTARTLLPGRAGAVGAALAVVGALVLAWRLDPAERALVSRLRTGQPDRQRDAALDLTRAHLGPHDRFLDCSGQFVTTALLPRRTSPGPPLLKPQQAAPCLAWIQAPPTGPGDTWIGVDPDRELRSGPGDSTGDVSIVDELPPTWEPVARSPHYTLYRTSGVRH